MTKYICHGCGKIYDDEIGMPGRCCDKIIRHKADIDDLFYIDEKEVLEKE